MTYLLLHPSIIVYFCTTWLAIAYTVLCNTKQVSSDHKHNCISYVVRAPVVPPLSALITLDPVLDYRLFIHVATRKTVNFVMKCKLLFFTVDDFSGIDGI
jgi:hypothetical protein